MTETVDELAAIFRGGGIVFFGTIIGRIFGFVGHILIANALFPNRFGKVGIAFTIVSMIGTISLVGIPKAVPRRMSEPERDQREVVSAGYTIALVFGSISATLVFVFADPLASAVGSPEVAGLLGPFAAYVMVYPLAMVAVSGLRGREQSTKATVVRDILGPVLPVGLFVAFNSVGRAFDGAIVYYVAIQGIIALAGSYLLIQELNLSVRNIRVRLGEIRDLVAFSWPLALSTNLILLMNNFDLLMIGYFLEAEAAGYYKTIQPLGLLVLLPLTSFTFLYLPIVTRYFEAGDVDFLGEVFSATTKWISLLSFPAVLVLVLFPESIVRTFFRPAFLPAVPALRVYALAMFIRVFVGPNGAMIKAIDETRVDLISALVGVVTNIVLNVVLIPRYGIVGAAVATGAGFLLYNLTEIAVIYRVVRIHPFSLNTLKPIVLTTLIWLSLSEFFVHDELGFLGLFVVGMGIVMVEIASVPVTRSLDSRDHQLWQRVLDRAGIAPERLPNRLRPREGEK